MSLQCAHAPCSECISAATLHEAQYFTLHESSNPTHCTNSEITHCTKLYTTHCMKTYNTKRCAAGTSELLHKPQYCNNSPKRNYSVPHTVTRYKALCTVMYFKNPKSMCTVHNCSLVQFSKAALNFSLTLRSNEPQ